jgi:hypothetical protein
MLQHGAKLLCVSDLLLLGRTTIDETRSLLHWLDSEAGFGKMGVCGLSMGKNNLVLQLLVELNPSWGPLRSRLIKLLKINVLV